MKKNLIKLICALVCLLTMAAFHGALAEDAIGISTPQELAAIANAPDEDYYLKNDIDLAGINWEPIPGFYGTLDGKGFTISNLTINLSLSSLDGIGLFGSYTGTVKNLNIKDANITISEPAAECIVSVIGSGPAEYCEVSGNITLSSSGNCKTDAYGLYGAYYSSSDVDITAECFKYMTIAGLYGCSYSQSTGDMALYQTAEDGVNVAAGLIKCIESENSGSITVYAAEQMDLISTEGEACGIIDSDDCINYGSISAYTGSAIGIADYSARCFNYGDIKGYSDACGICDYCSDCTNLGKITADNIVGVHNSSNCTNEGTMQYLGVDSWCWVSPVHDSTLSNYASSYNSNINTGTFVYIAEDGSIPELISYTNTLNSYSEDQSDINDVLNADVQRLIVNFYEGVLLKDGNGNALGLPVYERDIAITNHSKRLTEFQFGMERGVNHGNIAIDITGNGNGTFYFAGPDYNLGNIEVKVEGISFSVVGASHYNAGNITINSMGNHYTSATAIGVSSQQDNVVLLNEGDITVSVDGNASAMGTSGYLTYNTGNITAIGSEATARGAHAFDYGVNEGDVYARSFGENEPSEAIGAAVPGYCTGTVLAESDYGEAFAGSNNGTAIAKGYNRANAQGSICQATSTFYGATVSNGDFYCGYCEQYNEHGNVNCWGGDLNDGCFTTVTGEDTVPDFEKPEVDIPEKPVDFEVTLEPIIYSKNSIHHVIQSFTYACGSYMFDADDCSKFKLALTIEKEGEKDTGAFRITLPDGFSFEEYRIEKAKNLQYSFTNKDSVYEELTVYPMYSASMLGAVDFKVSGDGSETLSLPVVRAANEGVILCRNTVGVSKLDPSTPIKVSNTVDFAKEFNTSVSTFSDRLNELGCALTQAVYVEDFMMQSFENLGFTNAVYLHGLDNHDVGCAIAQKKIVLNDKVENILMVVVRGTLDTEWIGNFVVVNENSPNEHADFRNAANKVQERIAEYWNAANLGKNKDSVQMYICGHSRAAAATNLIAHDMNQANKPVSSDRLRAYTYAAPNSTKKGTGVAYTNLFNYVFMHDFVAYVPNGYEKHGQTYVVGLTEPANTAPSKVSSLFESYSGGQKYSLPNSPYLIGAILTTGELENRLLSNEALSTAVGYTLARLLPPGNGDVPQAHGAEGYLAWVNGNGINGQISFNAALKHMKGLAQDEFGRMAKIYGYSAKAVGTSNIPMYVLLRSMEMLYRNQGNRLLQVSCPVDVEVLDANGNVIASFKSHELQSADQTRVVAFSVDETDYILMPRDEELSVRITGTEDGAMALKLVQVDGSETDFELDESDVSARSSYTNVPLTAGESYRMAFATAGSATEWVLYDHEGNVYKGDAIRDAIYLPKALTELWDEAYMDTVSLKGNVICPENITSIGARAFANSAIEGIYIPAGCKLIAADAFENINPVIYCMEGSFAHTYAQTNGYEFVLMEKAVG